MPKIVTNTSKYKIPVLPAHKTTTYKNILAAVKAHVKVNNGWFDSIDDWYVGITNDPYARFSKHKSVNGSTPKYWISWYACSFRIARALETYLHEAGMQDKNFLGGATEESVYIYIYKKS